MAIPRSQLVDPEIPLHYHITSRCVRRSWLCGQDAYSGINYDHRKTWLEERLFQLATCFAVEIDAFAVMDNHFHLVLYYDPLACLTWSDDEVAWRWVEAFPPMKNGEVSEDLKPIRRDQLLANQPTLKDCRRKLGCLSTFMKHLKQPIARRANQEDQCTGHFFESRFYSAALLSEQAVLASMAYVDLNPVRARIARSIEQCQHTSIAKRLAHLENSREKLEEAVRPLVSGIGTRSKPLSITLVSYIAHLKAVISVETGAPEELPPDQPSRWYAQVAAIRKRQRAYGSEVELKQWMASRGWKRPGDSLP